VRAAAFWLCLVAYPPGLWATDKDWLSVLLNNSASREFQQQFRQKRWCHLFSYRSIEAECRPGGWVGG
jgi:hypothetical protein